jgi:hypothetical protein
MSADASNDIWRFEGKTVPVVSVLNLEVNNLRGTVEQHGIEIEFGFSIEDGNIKASCVGLPSEINTTIGYIERFIQRAVDAYAYINGFGCLVTLDTVIEPTGLRRNLHKYVPELFESKNERSCTDSTTDVAKLLTGPWQLADALFNLNLSIFFAHESPMFAFRALDTPSNKHLMTTGRR